MLDVADAALGRVGVQRLPALGLRERGRRAPAAGRGVEELDRPRRRVPPRMSHSSSHSSSVRACTVWTSSCSRPAAVQLAEDRGDAAGAVDVLHQVGRRSARPCRCTARGARARRCRHREVELGLLGGGEQVQHGVRRAAHRDVERHRVLERLARRDRAREDATRRPRRSSGARSRRPCGRRPRRAALRAVCVASIEPLPGSARPSASVRQFIELAVNMPRAGAARRAGGLLDAARCRRRRPRRRRRRRSP